MSTLDPLIEGYLSYLREVGRKTPRTVTDVRCTLRRAVTALGQQRPGVPLWRLSLQDYLHWLGVGREAGRASTSIAKDVSHVRGLLEYAWRSGRSERNVLDGFSVQHTLTRATHDLAAVRLRFAYQRAVRPGCRAHQPRARGATGTYRQGRSTARRTDPGRRLHRAARLSDGSR